MKSEDREQELAQSYRAEAVSFFQANQAGRTAAERVMALLLTAVAITVAAGINAGTDDVAIALPPIVLLMLSYMFQQYADVTVLGMARDAAEALHGDTVGRRALFYEYAVTHVRQRKPLYRSVRMLQVLMGTLVLAIVTAGAVFAYQDQPWYIEVGFSVGTSLSAASAVWSYKHMQDARKVAKSYLDATVPGFAEAREQAQDD